MPKTPFFKEGAVPYPTGDSKRRVFAGLRGPARRFVLALALGAGVLVAAQSAAAAQELPAYRIDASLAKNPSTEYRWVRLELDYAALQTALVAEDYRVLVTAAVGAVPPHLAGAGGVFVLQEPSAPANTYSIVFDDDAGGRGFAGQGGAFQLGYTGAAAEGTSCLAIRLDGFRVLDNTRQSREVIFVRGYGDDADRWAAYNTDTGEIKLQNSEGTTLTSAPQDLTTAATLTMTWCLGGARLQVGGSAAVTAATSPPLSAVFQSANLALVSGHTAADAAEGSATSAWQAESVELMDAASHTAAPTAKALPVVTKMAPVADAPLNIAASPGVQGAYQVNFGSPAQWTGKIYPAGAAAIAAIPPAQDVALQVLRVNHSQPGRLLPLDLSLATSVGLSSDAANVGAGFAWPLSIVGERATATLPPLLLASLFLVGLGGIAAVGAWKATRNLSLTAVATALCGACVVLMTPLPTVLLVLMVLGGGIAAAVVRTPAGVR